jgi:hypothetical protein
MKFLFLLIFIFASLNVFAQDSRWIDLEWEQVQDAREYEIELFQEEEGKILPRGKYKTDAPQWSHAVPPGKYFLRLRSMDKRGVPGEWSQNIPLKVRMQNPVLLRPSASDKISDGQVNFEWGAIVGASNYQLIVRNKDKDVIHNATSTEVKSSVYIEKLGDMQWTVLAHEKDEDSRKPADIPDSAFKSFVRVGGLLEAPKVSVTIGEKVTFSWDKVRSAQIYDVEYFPSPDSGEKNRRFKLKLSPLAFATQRLKDGVTTLTVKSTAEGYQDSNRSIVKISRSGNKVEVEDVIQGKEMEDIKTVPTKTFFRNDLFLGVSLAQFAYESENFETDTRLNQKSLTGIGFQAEWNRRPTLNSLNRKFEVSFLHLSSGIDSGFANRFAYTYHKEKKWGHRKFTYGAGLSYLSLPAFMGNRFDNKIEVEPTSSIGPDFQIGLINPLNNIWELQASLTIAYHPIFVTSRQSGEKALPWMRALVRVHRYYTEKQAFYGQLDYQSWNQEWKQDKSALSGISATFGVKTGF